ncbi:MAG: hypothetical protein ACK5Y2_13525 [Bdellovibrionales bacterium]
MSVENLLLSVTGENMTFRSSAFKKSWKLGLILGAGLLVIALVVLNLSGLFRSVSPVDKAHFKQFETPQIEMISSDSPFAAATPGRHPALVQWVFNQVFRWDPQDQGPAPKNECALGPLTRQLERAQAPREKTEIMNRYLQDCESQFLNGELKAHIQALRLFTMSYSIDDHPFLTRVLFHLPDGKKLKGLLAVKDQKRRPFVILRMGITGNIEEAFAERFFYYQLFERGLFNFLMVENMTGTDFIHHNRSVEFAGLAESYQNLWIAQLLRNPQQPISKLVESVHLVGLSLGGQGVLTSAWLSPVQKNPNLFQSFLALCPLVNLKPTFDHLFEGGGVGRLPLEVWAHSRFAEARVFYPELFDTYFGLPGRILKFVADHYAKPQADLFGVKEPAFLEKLNEFYALHDLKTWDPGLRKPVWIWVTKEDSIVPVHLNSATLPQADYLEIGVGNHCSFPAAWDGRVTQALFRGHILGASPNFKVSKKSVQLGVPVEAAWDVDDVSVKGSTGRVEVTLISKAKFKVRFDLGLEDLDFAFSSSTLTEPEKRMIRRWLSTNLTFEASPDGSGMTVSWPFVTP